MDSVTEQQLENLIEQDAEQVLAVGVNPHSGDMSQASVVNESPVEDIPFLLGAVLISAEEQTGVPAPILAYEATKRAEALGQEADMMGMARRPGDADG
jgi:hypothetical protein